MLLLTSSVFFWRLTCLPGLIIACAASGQVSRGRGRVPTPPPASDQLLAAVLACGTDPVLAASYEKTLLLANPAARQALGAPTGALEGEPLERVIHSPELLALLQELESGQRSVEVSLPDGRVYLATASTVHADGQPDWRVCVMRDVSHFKELDSMKSEFISMVSHDLRSPLTLIRGYTTMLEMGEDLNEQQRAYVSKIAAGVDHMAGLVDTLLSLGRIEAGLDLQVTQVPLMEIIGAVVEVLQLQAKQKGIDLRVEVGDDLPLSIDADRALLQQALYNLIENALKYTPGGRWVKLVVKAYPEAIQFEVRDNGIGISPADQPRLFEKFYRSSQREARAQGGSGLGLAIVRSIAERHAGKVWVESQLGEGSAFFLLMPVHQPERKAEPAEAV